MLLGELPKKNVDDDDDDEATGIIQEDPLLEEFISGGDTLLIKLLRTFNRNLEEQEAMIFSSPKEVHQIGTDMTNLREAFNQLKVILQEDTFVVSR